MKFVALLSGILASAIAWAATYFSVDVGAQFLTLWPQTNSQQLFGLVAWHGIVAISLVGGLIAVLSPLVGGLVLLGAVGAWVGIGLTLPVGFALPVAIPLTFSGLGVVAAFGAIVRGLVRRAASRRPPSLEDMAREDALRLDPDVDLRFSNERQSDWNDDGGRQEPSSSQPDAIQIAVRRTPEANVPHGLSGLFVANVTTLLLLTVAVGLLFYTNIRSGQLAAAFGTLPFAEAPSVPVAAAPAPAAEAPAVAATETPAAPAAATPEIPAAEVQVTSKPLDLAALPPSNWADPFAYCTAIKTIDFPDRRYIGPAVTETIASALKVPVSSSPDRVKWRCYDGAVLGCASFRGASCALTPTVAEMREYCAEHPNAADLQAPNGTWGCVETTPEIPQGASWPVDARGFLPGAWVEITAPGKPVTAG